MDEPDFELAIIATMSESISRLIEASAKTTDERMQTIATTAASICINTMLSTQRKSADIYSIKEETIQ